MTRMYVWNNVEKKHPKRLNVKVDYHLHVFYKAVAAENGCTLSDLLGGILEYAAKQTLEIDYENGFRVVDKYDKLEKRLIARLKFEDEVKKRNLEVSKL